MGEGSQWTTEGSWQNGHWGWTNHSVCQTACSKNRRSRPTDQLSHICGQTGRQTQRRVCLCADGKQFHQKVVVSSVAPAPRVQQTIRSTENTVRTGVFVGHNGRYLNNSVPKPSTSSTRSQKKTARTELFVGQGIRWTRGGGVGTTADTMHESDATSVQQHIHLNTFAWHVCMAVCG